MRRAIANGWQPPEGPEPKIENLPELAKPAVDGLLDLLRNAAPV
jgi:hypothetical protein